MRDNDGCQAWLAFLGGVAIMAAAIGAFLVFVGEGNADEARPRANSAPMVGRTEKPNCLNASACRDATPEFAAAYQDRQACDGAEKRVCLVPLGYLPKDLVDHLVAYYQAEYGLELHVLPTVSLARMEWSRPGQVAAEDLENLYTSAYIRLYNDRNVVLIGLTSLDIYTPERPEWKWFFGYTGDRHAVISAFRMEPVNWGERMNDDLRNKRVRTLMNKYIAMEYYGLPLNDNPRSVLYRLIGSLGTLDGIDERIPVQAADLPTRTPTTRAPNLATIPTATPAPMGVEAKGLEIALYYLDVLKSAQNLTASRPPRRVVEASLERLRDDYKGFLSELGCETDAMSVSERIAVFNAAIGYADATRNDDFTWFTEAVQFYGEDSKAARLLHEINALADYAMPDAYGGPRKLKTDCG